ncbi:HK97 gp10 family phage protein [Sporosarcina sp. FSL K6-5500]|uniref:HK97 gp10 family phage protein n=1 Tax=Sporosarcina sp. FSL K6-5500 TaxID=2921558 RepID=UPI0030F6DFD2
MTNNNGFADGLNRINTLLNVNQQVQMDVLKDAAEYFAEKLKPRINITDRNRQTHLHNSLKVVIEGDKVVVSFEDEAWYWFLAEHGHKKAGGKGRVAGLHFVRNTIDSEMGNIKEIMISEIINHMEG